MSNVEWIKTKTNRNFIEGLASEYEEEEIFLKLAASAILGYRSLLKVLVMNDKLLAAHSYLNLYLNIHEMSKNDIKNAMFEIYMSYFTLNWLSWWPEGQREELDLPNW